MLAEGSQRVLDQPDRIPALLETARALGATDLFVQVFCDRPGQREPIIGAGSATDLVQDDETSRRCGIQDPCGFDDIAGNADRTRFLFVQVAVFVAIDDARRFARLVVIDPDRHRIGPQLEVT